MVPRALKAAEQLMAEHKIDCEVIDPRTISPLDKATILASVKKTGHLVVSHEAWKTGGSGGEVAAVVAEEGFRDLKGPIVPRRAAQCADSVQLGVGEAVHSRRTGDHGRSDALVRQLSRSKRCGHFPGGREA